MADSWILKHLSAAIGIYQAAVDDHLIQSSLSVEKYRQFLARAWGWERGLEAALTTVTGLDWTLSRAKSIVIAQDLLPLGMTAEEVFALPSCSDAMEAIEGVPQGLGWLFVSERVSFAHGMAYHQLPVSVRKLATNYFESLLARTAWPDMLEAIDELSMDQAAVETLISSSTIAFRSRRAWFGPAARQTGRLVAFPKNDEVASDNSES